ncbi:hypothetical protein V5799_030803 [Amblyomma americanum]|uniref:Uncharacterized protein n=1 Tax=Amblyomma americanum TaxID=6943 RepID=A0AAQ4EN22_AMBAM
MDSAETSPLLGCTTPDSEPNYPDDTIGLFDERLVQDKHGMPGEGGSAHGLDITDPDEELLQIIRINS